MGQFVFTESRIKGLYIIESRVYEDNRGFFMETYNHEDFKAAGIDDVFVQDNHSRSARGVLRGLHLQKSRPQAKLVRVVRGEVFDVAVDLRAGSRTYGQWVGALLSEQNRRQIYIPKGFAHGFLALSEEAEVAYKCSDYYCPADEAGIIWNDPEIAVEWPLDRIGEVILSEKDRCFGPLSEL